MLNGGEGNDVLIANGNSNGDTLNGGDGADTILVGYSGYLYYARYPSYAAIDGAPITINGGAGNDNISALSHAVIDGGDGDDVITVGTGDRFEYSPNYTNPVGTDTTIRLMGGAGADTFVVGNAVGLATITDFTVGVDNSISARTTTRPCL